MRGATIFLAGLLFSSGLVVSKMTQPGKVIGFLDFFGNWDPSLALVMGGAVSVHALSYRWIRGKTSPLFGGVFSVPSRTDIDANLLVGAALFGLGWGLSGLCPGPALSSLVTLDPKIFLFVGSMLTSMLVYSVFTRRVSGTLNRDRRDHELGQPREVAQRDVDLNERGPEGSLVS